MDHREDAERLSDQALMGRMRLGEAAAFREFFLRFEPMLREIAGQQGTMRDDARELVLEVLDDVAERIRGHRVARDVSLAGYLANALRNRVLDERRQRARRRGLELTIAASLDGRGEGAVLSACSAHSIRAARSPDEMEAEDDPIVEAFHRFIDGLLSDDERQLLGWLGERVPQREIAEWMGATHGAVRVRVHRLRARLATSARTYLARLAPSERARLERLYGAGTRRAPADHAPGTGRTP